MYAYLKGTLEHIDENYIVIDVNGVGYKVYVAASIFDKLPMMHNLVKVFTYLHVKEDIMDLYGFIDREQQSMFELLISVSGVGPKAALAVLSTNSVTDFALAVVSSDEKTITKAPGIGKKIAQRIILELKDKIKSEELVGVNNSEMFDTIPNHSSEAVNALVVLGYSTGEAARAVQAVQKEGLVLEDIITLALKYMMKQ